MRSRPAEPMCEPCSTALGSLATSTPEPFPALLFFGALARRRTTLGSSIVGEFRLQANARCMTATDPLDPVYAMAALVMYAVR